MTSENVVVISWYGGVVEQVFFESREDAIKRCLSHNMSELHYSDQLDDETKEVINKILELMKSDKWNEANSLWHDENMWELDYQYSHQMEWRPIDKPESLETALAWLKTDQVKST